MPDLSSPLDRFRQPEYTGENRCVPCTTVNLVIAVLASVVVALVNPLVGATVLVVSALAIYLRGYLVPGTPTLTKRYVPDWLLAKFDKADLEPPAEPTPPEADADALENPETALLDNGVIAPCPDVEDLCLEADVRAEWRAEIVDLREGDRADQLATILEVDPDELTVDVGENGQVSARTGGRPVGRWESEAALVADLAAHHVLASRIPGWESIPLEGQSAIAAGLRAFAETCPVCDGPISLTEDTVESCCRAYQVHAVTCEDCTATVLEITQ